MTIDRLPDAASARGRVVKHPHDPWQGVALLDDDGSRLDQYDDYLRFRAQEVSPATLRAIARALLLWQRFLWLTSGASADLGTARSLWLLAYSTSYAWALAGHVGDYLAYAEHVAHLDAAPTQKAGARAASSGGVVALAMQSLRDAELLVLRPEDLDTPYVRGPVPGPRRRPAGHRHDQ